MIIEVYPVQRLRMAVMRAYLRLTMPPDKWVLFEAGHTVRWTRSYSIHIPFFGTIIWDRFFQVGPL